MNKLTMKSKDLTQENIDKIAAMFTNVVTESKDEQGNIQRSIDFDLLRQELSDVMVEGEKERYQLTWPGKKEAILKANTPIDKALRPVKEDSVDWDTTENLYIEGDNLEVMKLLQESYLNKVKYIYLDPPYNTGNDFVYIDDFKQTSDDYINESGQVDNYGNRLFLNNETNGRFHSDWLTMMYSRLKLARNLLRDDGIILISIDDNELNNLILICNEIFGANNFIENVVWKKRYGAGGGTNGFAKIHEYILVYSKNPIENLEAPLSEEQISSYKNKDEKFSVRGGYVTQPLATSSKGERSNLMYSISHNGKEIKPKKGSRWLWSKEKFDRAYANNEIVINEKNGQFSVRFKQYLKDENGVIRNGKPLSIKSDVFNQEGTKEVADLLGNRGIFDFPKPVDLLKYLFSFIINNNDEKDGIFLDLFSGSGSSAHAVMQLNAEDSGNRKFIMIQLPEIIDESSQAFKAGYFNICDIGKERIRRSAKKIKAESGVDIDYGFRVYRVDSSNMKDVFYTPDKLGQVNLDVLESNIKEDRTGEDLLIQVMLEAGLELSLPMETKQIEGKTIYYVAGNSLIVCFDEDITESVIKQITEEQPLRVVFRDSSFSDDSARINVEELFKMLSPSTEIQVL